MSSIENDSMYNSSNDDDGGIVGNSRSSRPPPGLTRGVQMGNRGIVGKSPDNHGKSGGEDHFKHSEERDDLEELGLNLGRRLARLELGNKINAEKLEKIKELFKVKEKTRAMENARVDDLEGKLISMEARLASEEKQGFDAKDKIGSLKKTLKIKDKEILELKEMLSKADAKRVKEEGRLSKLEEGSAQLTKQFIILLETCETFNDELQSLKKINIEFKRELKKKEEVKIKSPVCHSGGQTSQNATKPEGLPSLANGVLNVKSDQQKVTSSNTIQASQNAFNKLFNSAADESAKPGKKVNDSNSSPHPSGHTTQELVPGNTASYTRHSVQELVPGNAASYTRYYYSGPAGPRAQRSPLFHISRFFIRSDHEKFLPDPLSVFKSFSNQSFIRPKYKFFLTRLLRGTFLVLSVKLFIRSVYGKFLSDHFIVP